MTTERLRELRDQHAPKDDGLTSLHDDLEKCIAQAEAQEAHAIGEQTPVAWIYEDTLPEGYPYDLMYPCSEVRDFVRMFPVYGPSPMSSEARDKAIEAGNAMRVQLLALALDYRDAMLAKGGTELDLHPAHYDALDAWDQALSALRAERPPTISPKGPQEA